MKPSSHAEGYLGTQYDRLIKSSFLVKPQFAPDIKEHSMHEAINPFRINHSYFASIVALTCLSAVLASCASGTDTSSRPSSVHYDHLSPTSVTSVSISPTPTESSDQNQTVSFVQRPYCDYLRRNPFKIIDPSVFAQPVCQPGGYVDTREIHAMPYKLSGIEYMTPIPQGRIVTVGVNFHEEATSYRQHTLASVFISDKADLTSGYIYGVDRFGNWQIQQVIKGEIKTLQNGKLPFFPNEHDLESTSYQINVGVFDSKIYLISGGIRIASIDDPNLTEKSETNVSLLTQYTNLGDPNSVDQQDGSIIGFSDFKVIKPTTKEIERYTKQTFQNHIEGTVTYDLTNVLALVTNDSRKNRSAARNQ